MKKFFVFFPPLWVFFCFLTAIFFIIFSYRTDIPLFSFGIDLKGGSQILYQQDKEYLIKREISILQDGILSYYGEENIFNIHSAGNSLKFSSNYDIDIEDFVKRRMSPKEIRGISIKKDSKNSVGQIDYTIVLLDSYINLVEKEAFTTSISVIQDRIDKSGSKEVDIRRRGDHIVVLVPSVYDVSEIENLISVSGVLSLRENSFASDKYAQKFFLQNGQTVYLRKHSDIDGSMINSVAVERDPVTNDPVIFFRLNREGTILFSKLTRKNVKKPIAIVMDDLVISNPVVQSVITNGSVIISGGFTNQSAAELARIIKSGSLAAPLELIGKSSVDPVLGKNRIERGIWAIFFSFIFLLMSLLLFYGVRIFFLLFICILHVLSLVLIFFSLSKTTMTLSGIAGIILTIGMCVDAMVIVLERVQVRQMKGRIPYDTFLRGYKESCKGIIDANMTSLIVCLVLYVFGVGGIRKFALSLSVGIISSFVVLTTIFYHLFVLSNTSHGFPKKKL